MIDGFMLAWHFLVSNISKSDLFESGKGCSNGFVWLGFLQQTEKKNIWRHRLHIKSEVLLRLQVVKEHQIALKTIACLILSAIAISKLLLFHYSFNSYTCKTRQLSSLDKVSNYCMKNCSNKPCTRQKEFV